MSATANQETVKANIEFLHAYLECSDAIQEGVREMMKIVVSDDTDEDEKRMAMHTIADALYPNPHKGKLGMDLEESESEAAQDNPELRQIVDDMNAEEDLFADRLREAMESRGLTQGQLAALTGVGQPAISNMLNRQCRPQQRTIAKLAEALRLNPSDLWPAME